MTIMHIIQQLGYLAFSLNDGQSCICFRENRSKIILSALIHFSVNLTCGDQMCVFFFFFFSTDNHGPTRTYKPELWHRLASCSASLYLPSLSLLSVQRVSMATSHPAPSPPWLANTVPAVWSSAPSIAVAQTGTPLCQKTKKDNTSDLRLKAPAPRDKQMRDT